MPRQILKFEIDQPQTVALEFPDGVNVQGSYGPQVKFSLTENRIIFVDPDVAQAIRTLGCLPGEPFAITKRWEKGKRVWWDIEKVKRAGAGAILASDLPDSLFQPPKMQPANREPAKSAIPEANPPRIQPQATNVMPPRQGGMQLTRTPPVKPSYEEAFRECLRIVREGLADAGEAWSDHSVQAMCSTLFIQAAREGTMRFTVPQIGKVA
jgi:hypothetical protein